jgi:hypothetical protein
LFVAAVAFPIFEQSAAWRDYAKRLLEREIVRQTFPDGMNRELAFEYHLFVSELFLVAGVEGDIADAPFSKQFWERIRSMVDLVAATVDVRQNPPRLGDGDGSTALLVNCPGQPKVQSLLATGAALFNAPVWWPDHLSGDLRTAFLSAHTVARLDFGSRLAERQSLFKESGIVILRDLTSRPDEIWCRYDCGPHGFLSIAAHAHADALSIEVRHGGIEILADPGTYCFYCEPKWREYFRSTIAHNTLEVDNQSQAVDGGKFLWMTQAQARLTRVSNLGSGAIAECEAYHEGYRRLRPPVIHHRSVRLDRIERCIQIMDWLETARSREVRTAFHIGPNVICELQENKAMLSWSLSAVTFVGELTLASELDWTSYCGQMNPPLGWYSRRFGQLQPATVLIGNGIVEPGTRLNTQLKIQRFDP